MFQKRGKMASSLIHLAITNEFANKIKVKDIKRLRMGSMLPDNVGPKGHLKISICGNHKKTYNLEYFRKKFIELIKEDDLYLGYYLHLVQDILYRRYVYTEHNWNPLIPGNVERLHRDYEICNSYVIEKYELTKEMIESFSIDGQAIRSLAEFNIEEFAAKVRDYFNPVDFDDIYFFTKEMADEFISKAVEMCINEVKNLQSGEELIDSYEWAWDNMPSSLLETTLNTRDLGGYRSDDDKTYLNYCRMLRSDVQNYPSNRDIKYLKNLGIQTIIDMRGKKDVVRKPSGFAKREGFDYHNIQIDEGSGLPETVEMVSKLYMAIAQSKNMPDVFKTIANAKDGVMINCSAGKDRTGVVSAILLSLCGVSRKDIIYDYMITKVCNKERFDLLHKNFPEVDMNIVIPKERYMQEFLDMFKERYGNAEAYLLEIGLVESEIRKIKHKLK